MMRSRSHSCGGRGFTLIELLVVIAVIGILASLIGVVVGRGLEMARSTKCTANLKALHIANFRYAMDHKSYVPAASDMFSRSNGSRWHGVRAPETSSRFDGAKGPLAGYFPGGYQFRQCPSLEVNPELPNQFEKSCGGYGYNLLGVGSRSYIGGFSGEGLRRGMNWTTIVRPSETVMFTDAAFGQPYGNPTDVIEYSFAEPRRQLNGRGGEAGKAIPSIHFRHLDRANVVWCDGHVAREAMTIEYDSAHTALGIGWFGPDDNSLFDPW